MQSAEITLKPGPRQYRAHDQIPQRMTNKTETENSDSDMDNGNLDASLSKPSTKQFKIHREALCEKRCSSAPLWNQISL